MDITTGVMEITTLITITTPSPMFPTITAEGIQLLITAKVSSGEVMPPARGETAIPAM